MISPFMTDSEILRACAFTESPLIRVMSDRLRSRVDQMDNARRMADGVTDDPGQTLADIAETLKRD